MLKTAERRSAATPGQGYALRIDNDGIDLHAHGERLAVAVVDRAARRLDFDFADLLGIGVLAVFFVVEDLKIDQAEDEDEAPDKTNAREDPQPFYGQRLRARVQSPLPWKPTADSARATYRSSAPDTRCVPGAGSMKSCIFAIPAGVRR